MRYFIKAFDIFIFLLIGFSSFGQTNIKVMSYNLMHYPNTRYYDNETGTFSDRAPVLQAILEEIEPDIFFVCELQEDQAADYLLQEALIPINAAYEKADFTYNHSSSYTDLQQMLYFNSEKLTIENQSFIYTNIRDINHYTLSTNTSEPVLLEVFVAHLKASQGDENEYKRFQMCQAFTTYLDNLPEDSYVIFGGDFNFYSSYENGYQELMDSSNSIKLVDPINRSGNWHNSYSSRDIHTQSPLQSNSHFQNITGGSDGVTGGMDDRFDFILLSENFQNSTEVYYVEDSYKAYGNNGDCYNGSINDTACSGDYSVYTRELLHNMSDHIPVLLEVEIAPNIGTSSYYNDILFSIIASNYTDNSLELSIDTSLLGNQVSIINCLGQVVLKQMIESNRVLLDVSSLETGVYYLSIPKISVNSPLKFVKK